MTFLALSQLLKSTLVLLAMVGMEPDMSQSLRDTAHDVAQNAIQHAVATIQAPLSQPADAQVATASAVIGARPSVSLYQSMATTTTDGATGQSFIISWSSTNASSCSVSRQRVTPVASMVNSAWATGISGVRTAAPVEAGTLHWWVECAGPGGTARADIYHAVTERDARPNIIIIMTDDQDDMGSLAAMPNVRRLIGEQGVTFTNSFVTDPLCCPSRASFLTGQYVHNHGIFGNDAANGGGYGKFKSQDANTLPVWLKSNGYFTALIGKYLNGYGDNITTPNTYVPPGWSEWQGVTDLQNYFGFTINRNGTIVSAGPGDYLTDVLNQRAVSFIESRADTQPFFLWLAHKAPHGGGGLEDSSVPVPPAPRHVGTYTTLPLPRPPSFNEADFSDKPLFMQQHSLLSAETISFVEKSFRSRRESLIAVDEGVAMLIAALEKAGTLENTIIIFTSDNGFSHGEHRRAKGKHLLYEESIRVPLIIRGPGFPKGVFRTELVNNIDVVATILAAAQTQPGRPADGRSLHDLFSATSPAWRSTLLIEGLNTLMQVTSNETKGRYAAVRTPTYVYAEHTGPSGLVERELYDLSTDPYQLESKANDAGYSSVAAALGKRLAELISCAGSNCFTVTPEPARSLPSVTLMQSVETSRSDGVTGQPFTITWNSTNTSSCLIWRRAPDGVLSNPPWGTGVSGIREAASTKIGTFHWWIECTGPNGTARADMYHHVVP